MTNIPNVYNLDELHLKFPLRLVETTSEVLVVSNDYDVENRTHGRLSDRWLCRFDNRKNYARNRMELVLLAVSLFCGHGVNQPPQWEVIED